jgi:hypothetical protein
VSRLNQAYLNGWSDQTCVERTHVDDPVGGLQSAHGSLFCQDLTLSTRTRKLCFRSKHVRYCGSSCSINNLQMSDAEL